MTLHSLSKTKLYLWAGHHRLGIFVPTFFKPVLKQSSMVLLPLFLTIETPIFCCPVNLFLRLFQLVFFCLLPLVSLQYFLIQLLTTLPSVAFSFVLTLHIKFPVFFFFGYFSFPLPYRNNHASFAPPPFLIFLFPDRSLLAWVIDYFLSLLPNFGIKCA